MLFTISGALIAVKQVSFSSLNISYSPSTHAPWPLLGSILHYTIRKIDDYHINSLNFPLPWKKIFVFYMLSIFLLNLRGENVSPLFVNPDAMPSISSHLCVISCFISSSLTLSRQTCSFLQYYYHLICSPFRSSQYFFWIF